MFLKVISELVSTLLGGLQGSRSCTFALEFIFPEAGDLEVRLAPAPPSSSWRSSLLVLFKGNQAVEAFKPGQEGLAPSGKVNIYSGEVSVSLVF